MTVTLVCFVLTAGILYASWTLILEASQGKRWITLSRQSAEQPESVLRRIDEAWTANALTFEPVRLLPDSTDELKTFTLKVESREYRTTLKRLPAPAGNEFVLTCVAANGEAYPLGREHRKIWAVAPRKTGSLVRVTVTFKAPPSAILQAIFTFRRQLRMIAGR